MKCSFQKEFAHKKN